MKIKVALYITSIFLSSIAYGQGNLVELSMNKKSGFGPFGFGLAGVSTYSDNSNSPWENTHLTITGLPNTWTELKIGDIETNVYQSTYQSYMSGNITKEWYESLQKSWNWQPDTTKLSRRPVKTKIAFAYGKDANGETQMVIDVNNNLDLSDDPIFNPIVITEDNHVNWDSLVTHHTIMVSYEHLSGNNIIQDKAPLFIVLMKKINMYMCCFPQYATAQLNGKALAICPDGFSDLSYTKTGLVITNSDTMKHVDREKIISQGEYISIDGQLYLNKGVNTNKNVLMLDKINTPPQQLYSTQVGFKSFAFEGQLFKTNTFVSLDNLRGKYLLLDFWAVWCGPCRQEIPNLKDLYQKTDKSKFEILGIVGNSSSDELEEMINKYSITWPQLLSDEKNKIKEKYGVTGYPTTFLISPEGIIVAKNLRGKELENKMNELIK